jgi:hypothetical protein
MKIIPRIIPKLNELTYSVVPQSRDSQNRTADEQIRDVGDSGNFNPERDNIEVSDEYVTEDSNYKGSTMRYDHSPYEDHDWVTIFTKDLFDPNFYGKNSMKNAPYNKILNNDLVTDKDITDITSEVKNNLKTFANPAWAKRAKTIAKNVLIGKDGYDYSTGEAVQVYNRASGADPKTVNEFYKLLNIIITKGAQDAELHLMNKVGGEADHLLSNLTNSHKKEYGVESTSSARGFSAHTKEKAEENINDLLDDAIKNKNDKAKNRIDTLLFKNADIITNDEDKDTTVYNVDANKLLQYGVVINNTAIVRRAIQIEASTGLNVKQMVRNSGGRFETSLINKLLKSTQNLAILRLLENLKKRKNENNMTRINKIRITERQARLLSLLKVEESAAIDATKDKHGFGYKTPEGTADATRNMNKTDYAKQLKNAREKREKIAPKITKDQFDYKPPCHRKTMLNGKEIQDSEKTGNQYQTRENIIITKKELMEGIFQNINK